MITQIANAVKTELNDSTFSISFAAEMTLLPVFELADMRDLKVTVVPKAQSFQRISRIAGGREIQIDIGVQKKFSAQSEAEELLGLVEEIATFFDGKRLTGANNAICVKVANEPVYAPEHIQQYRQFTSVLTLTFKVF
jgi:hypothetical protein